MREVTKGEFFAVLGDRDVVAHVDEATLRGRYHVSTWETRGRYPVGRSVADSHGVEPTRFYLAEEG